MRAEKLQPNVEAALGRKNDVRASVDARNAKATRLFEEGKITEAIAEWKSLVRSSGLSDTLCHISLSYNLACAYARMGMLQEALAKLEELVQAGYFAYEAIQEDLDLASLRGLRRYDELLGILRSEQRLWDSTALNTPFRENLSTEQKTAGLSKLWCEVKFNFAWFDRVPELDWDQVYMEYLARVITTSSTLEYYRLLQEMCARLHDGHTLVRLPDELRCLACSQPGVHTRLVEDKVVIVEVLDEDLRRLGVAVGVEVLEIDSVPVLQYASREVAPYQSASTKQGLNVKTYEYGLLAGASGTSVTLLLRDKTGSQFSLAVPRTESFQHKSREVFKFEILAGGVGYVGLNGFDGEYVVECFDSAFESIAHCPKIIIDIRENTGGSSLIGWRILSYLSAKPFPSTEWCTREYRAAYRAWKWTGKWHHEGPLQLPPHPSKYYEKPVALLTSPRTCSAAEDFAVVFDAMSRGKIVGEPTAGTTGQPLIFRLPGGGEAWVCAKRDRYPDGREFVGTGVQPSRRVSPQLVDICDRRDVALEVALEELGSAT